MAKEEKKPKKDVSNLEKTSRADLEYRLREAKRERKDAKAEGNKELKSKLDDKVERLRGAIENRDVKNLGIEGQKSYEDILNSDEVKQFTPETRALLRSIVDSYTPEELKDMKLTPNQIKDIANGAKAIAVKDFKIKRDRLEQDYTDSLAADIQTLKKQQQRNLEDMQGAMEGGDMYTAEQYKVTARVLQDSLAEAEQLYQTESARKREYLSTKLGQIQSDLETGMTRLGEDEIANLRAIEREAKQKLDGLQDQMGQLGYASSGKRFSEEADLANQTEEFKTITKRQADRQRADLSTMANRQSDELSILTQQDLADLTSQYGQDLRGAIQNAESFIGTNKVGELINPNQQANLVGGQTGSLYKQQQDTQKYANRSLEDSADAFVSRYGTDEYMKDFGTSGYTPNSGIVGTYNRNQQRGMEDLRQTKKDLTSQLTSKLTNLRMGIYQ